MPLSKKPTKTCLNISSIGNPFLLFRLKPKRRSKKYDKKINILFIITDFCFGGAEIQLIEVLSNINQEQFHCTVSCLRGKGELASIVESMGIKIYSNLMSSKYDIRVLYKLIRIIKKEKIHVVFIVGIGDKMFWGQLAGLLAGVKVIVIWIHTWSFKTQILRKRLMLYLNKISIPLATRLLCLGELHKNNLVLEEGIKPSKIEIIPNGIDLSKVTDAAVKPYTKGRHNIPDGSPLVGIIGGLRPIKGHEFFLRAADIVHRRRRDVHFLIVGDDVPYEEPMRLKLQDICHKLHLDPFVHFLGNRKDVFNIIHALDILVLSSKNEVFPLCVLEGMAAGKPIVAARVGCMPELVEDGTTGYLVPPNNENALAEKILQLLNNPDLARTMGLKAKRKVEDRYSIEKTTGMVENLISELFHFFYFRSSN